MSKNDKPELSANHRMVTLLPQISELRHMKVRICAEEVLALRLTFSVPIIMDQMWA